MHKNYSEIIAAIHKIEPAKYAKTRNFLDGAVTKLSPYISRGIISVNTVYKILLEKNHSLQTAEKLIQELAWREFFQRVHQAKKWDLFSDLKQEQQNVTNRQMPEALRLAETGIEAIDEAIHTLYNTGYLHNHLRMYLASIACNVAQSHWREPSKWMYYYLLDADAASNTCSWQWVAGSFSSKKYFANQENINNYCNSKQRATFLDTSYEALAEMEIPYALESLSTKELHTAWPVLELAIIDVTKPICIYTSYNLDPLWLADLDCNRVLLLEPKHFNEFAIGKNSMDFIIYWAKQITGMQIVIADFETFQAAYPTQKKYFKEHPFTNHFIGEKHNRDWMFPQVTGYFPSFFGYWKKAQALVRKY